MSPIVSSGQEKGFAVEQGRDYGAGPVDVVWKINVHPTLPEIRCGFIALRAEEGGGSKDTEDNQFSMRKIEEAAMRGLRSGMDKVFLVTGNEEMARSVSGQIEWLASHGSLLRLDAVSLGWTPGQERPSVITPSQERVPEGEKLRKEEMREREAKLDRHSRPKGRAKDEESPAREALRESRIDRNSRPKGHIPKSRRTKGKQ